MTPFAGAEAIRHAFSNRSEKAAVFPARFPRRASQAAKNAGRDDTDIGPALIRGIAGQQRVIKFVLVWEREQHDTHSYPSIRKLQPHIGRLFNR
jgi:hypothetical protein